MKYLKAIYFWLMLFFVTFGLYWVIIIGSLFRLIMDKKSFSNFCHNVATTWGRSTIFLMTGWKITIKGKENLPDKEEPLLIVANHESMSDIWAIYFLGIQFRWIAKVSLFKIPFVGRCMKWADYVPVDRGNKLSHKKAIIKSIEILNQGTPMFFFPEGTRSKTGKIGKFKLGAFKLSAQQNVPVLPIALTGAKDLMQKGSAFPGKALVQIKILPRTSIKDGEDIEVFAERVRNNIIKAHDSFATIETHD